MKKLYAALYALIILSIAGAGICLSFLPDQIPAHYNFAGEVDRMGSKYETLLLPAFAVLMGAFLLLLAKYCAGKGRAPTRARPPAGHGQAPTSTRAAGGAPVARPARTSSIIAAG